MPSTARTRSAEGSRAKILDAAEELFSEQGYDATPTSHIADRADVYKGLVFHYFPRKIDLLLALVERVPIEEIASLEAEVVRGDVTRTLLNVATDFDEWHCRSSTTRRILFREAPTHAEVGKKLAEVNAGLVERVRIALDAALADRKIPARRRAAAANAFAAAILQRRQWRDTGLPDVDLEAVAELVASALERR